MLCSAKVAVAWSNIRSVMGVALRHARSAGGVASQRAQSAWGIVQAFVLTHEAAFMRLLCGIIGYTLGVYHHLAFYGKL